MTHATRGLTAIDDVVSSKRKNLKSNVDVRGEVKVGTGIDVEGKYSEAEHDEIIRHVMGSVSSDLSAPPPSQPCCNGMDDSVIQEYVYDYDAVDNDDFEASQSSAEAPFNKRSSSSSDDDASVRHGKMIARDIINIFHGYKCDSNKFTLGGGVEDRDFYDKEG